MERRWPRHARRLSIVIVLLLFVDGLYVSVRLASSLLGAGDHLQTAASAFSERDFSEADDEFQQAGEDASDASGLSWHPSYFLARVVPGIKGDADSARRLAEASERAAQAGVTAVQAVEDAGLEEDLTGAFYSNGRVDIETVTSLQAPLRRVSRLLADAEELLREAPDPRISLVDKALGDGLVEVSDAASSARKASLLVDALPRVTGGNRSYLLAFQAPSESRGTGGLMGMVGVLRARNGRLELGKIVETEEIARRLTDEVDAPEWYTDRYGGYDATQDFKQANLSAHFPTVARVWLDMYEAETGKSLDGVLAMDPVALQSLMRATGSIQDPVSNITIASNTAAEFLMHDSYVQLSDEEQPEVLRRMVSEFWERVAAGNLGASELAEGMGEATDSGHLKVFMADDELGNAFRELDVDGDFTDEPNTQLVFHNNSAGNKVDFFMHRSIESEVTLNAAGEALVETRIRMVNRAPKKGPRLLLGPYLPNDPPGMNRAFVNVVMPQGAEVTGYSVNGSPRESFVADEAGHPVVWDLFEILPGDHLNTVVRYRVPGAVEVFGDGARAELAFSFVPQPTAQADRLRVRVNPPEGFTFSDGQEEVPRYTWAGAMDDTVEIELELLED